MFAIMQFLSKTVLVCNMMDYVKTLQPNNPGFLNPHVLLISYMPLSLLLFKMGVLKTCISEACSAD